MNTTNGKQNELKTSSKHEHSDNLTFLRDMIDNTQTSPESIDYQFLQKELYKRRPQPIKQKKGIELIEPQTKPPTRKPNYIKSPYSITQTRNTSCNRPKSHIREITYTFHDTNAQPEIKTRTEIIDDNSQLSENQNNSQFNTNTVSTYTDHNGPKQPKSYLSWKFIGDTKDGNFGILTGKIDARETPTTLKRNFASIPYVLDRYHIEFEEVEQEVKPKVHPRDLFSLSIAKDRPNYTKNARTISRLQQQKLKQPIHEYQSDPDTQLYLETDERLIPLVASRLPRGAQT